MAGRGRSRLIERLSHLQRTNRLAGSLLGPAATLRRKWIDHQWYAAMRAAEHAERRIVGDVILDMPEFEGRFACSPRSHLFRRVLLHDGYETEIAARFRDLVDPGRDVVDVGANIGFYTVLAARHLDRGKVLALEPVTAARARLEENCAANAVIGKVEILAAALAEAPGTAEIALVEGCEEYSALDGIIHPAVEGRAQRSESVAVDTLDRLVERHSLSPGLVKIDVEGAEMRVIEGARETIGRHRPVLLVELADALLRNAGSSAGELLKAFDELGYRCENASDPTRPVGVSEHGSVLCFPR